MKKINEIEIKITKAIITKVWIELESEKPKYTIQGWLLTDQGRKVSEFIFWSDSYNEDAKVEIPVELHQHAAEIFKALTPVIYRKINGMYKELPTPKK